jgi:hypothetical protein
LTDEKVDPGIEWELFPSRMMQQEGTATNLNPLFKSTSDQECGVALSMRI